MPHPTSSAFAWIAVVAAAGGSWAAPPGPLTCAESVSRWQVGRGALLADVACGAFLLSTDAEDHAGSVGEASLRQPVHLPYEVSLRWRRLGPEGNSPLWVRVLGGHLVFRDGGVGLWFNSAQSGAGEYQAVPGLDLHGESFISIVQSRHQLTVRINGAPAKAIPHKTALTRGALAVGLSGARGYRSFMSFRDVSVRELSQ